MLKMPTVKACLVVASMLVGGQYASAKIQSPQESFWDKIQNAFGAKNAVEPQSKTAPKKNTAPKNAVSEKKSSPQVKETSLPPKCSELEARQAQTVSTRGVLWGKAKTRKQFSDQIREVFARHPEQIASLVALYNAFDESFPSRKNALQAAQDVAHEFMCEGKIGPFFELLSRFIKHDIFFQNLGHLHMNIWTDDYTSNFLLQTLREMKHEQRVKFVIAVQRYQDEILVRNAEYQGKIDKDGANLRDQYYDFADWCKQVAYGAYPELKKVLDAYTKANDLFPRKKLVPVFPSAQLRKPVTLHEPGLPAKQ